YDSHPSHSDSSRANTVHVFDCQSGIVERAADAFRHDLEHALVGREPGRMLICAGHAGFTAETHVHSSYLSSARNFSIALLRAAGCSTGIMCPASAITSSREP